MANKGNGFPLAPSTVWKRALLHLVKRVWVPASALLASGARFCLAKPTASSASPRGKNANMASQRFVPSLEAEAAQDSRRRIAQQSRRICGGSGPWRATSERAFMKHVAFSTGARTSDSLTSAGLVYEQSLPIDRMMIRVVDAPARA